MPSVALILTTYNRPAALDRVLDSVARQTVLPEQVIIADDGSDERTTAVVEAWRPRLRTSLHHAWQPDDGFRAAASRNRAARDATTDLLLFVDGDCLLRTGVVAEHRRLAEAGCAVAGNRILLSPRLTEAVEQGLVDPVGWQLGDWVKARLQGDVERLWPLITLPGPCLAAVAADPLAADAGLQHGGLPQGFRAHQRLRGAHLRLGLRGLRPRHPADQRRHPRQVRPLRHCGAAPVAPGAGARRRRAEPAAGAGGQEPAGDPCRPGAAPASLG